MNEQKHCPECGSDKRVEAESAGFGGIKKIGKVVGTWLKFEVCAECGYVISMKAVDPKKLL